MLHLPSDLAGRLRGRTLSLLTAATLAGAALAALAFSNCRATSGGSAALNAAPAAGRLAGSRCDTPCADVTADRDWARCYACRCKEAMDGWLPTALEVSCAGSNTTDIPVYAAAKAAGGVAMSAVTTEVSECLNPPRLDDARAFGGGCFPGSKLGQLQHGDIWVKFICRREKWHTDWRDPKVIYDDTGLIIHNNRTGATCFYDDVDEHTDGGNNPEIDVADAPDAAVDAEVGRYYRQDGASCAACHDAGPFQYSPYLRGAKWRSDAGYADGPYWRVDTDGAKHPIGKHLVGPNMAACISCHRIGQGGTCAFALDSIQPDIDSMQAFLKTPGPDGYGVVKTPDGLSWSYPPWMPIEAALPPTLSAWNTRYGKASDTIRRCCDAAHPPTDPTLCQWQDTPTGDEGASLRLR